MNPYTRCSSREMSWGPCQPARQDLSASEDVQPDSAIQKCRAHATGANVRDFSHTDGHCCLSDEGSCASLLACSPNSFDHNVVYETPFVVGPPHTA